jgi:hypothetical protein
MVKSREHGRKRAYRYACSSYHLRGTSICPNKLEVPLADADAAILGIVDASVLQPDVLDVVLDGALLELSTAVADDAQRAAVETEIAGLDAELLRLTTALARGGDLEVLVDAVKSRQQRRDALDRGRQTLNALNGPLLTDRDMLEQKIAERLTDWRGLLGRNVAWSRQLLTKLLKGRIMFTPTADEDGRPAYDVETTFTLGRFFSGILCPKGMASPAGFVRCCTVEIREKWTMAA